MMQPCHRQAMPCRLLRVVRQVRTEPALNLFDRETTAYGVILDLVATEAADTEVAGGGVREDQAADRGGRRHRERLRQPETELVRLEQLEQFLLLGVVRARRVPEGRPDPAEPLRVQIFQHRL